MQKDNDKLLTKFKIFFKRTYQTGGMSPQTQLLLLVEHAWPRCEFKSLPHEAYLQGGKCSLLHDSHFLFQHERTHISAMATMTTTTETKLPILYLELLMMSKTQTHTPPFNGAGSAIASSTRRCELQAYSKRQTRAQLAHKLVLP